jgi:hypothetical protein
VRGWAAREQGQIRGFSDCGFELTAGLKVALGLERVDLVGGNGRDDVNEGIGDDAATAASLD